MEAEKITKKKDSKKPASNLQSNLDTNFHLIIQNTLEEVLGEVQSQLKDVSLNFKVSLQGIEKEISEIKSIAKRNRTLLINLAGTSSVEEKEPELISTGFDILTKVPSHLRRTYKVMLTKEMGATASDVARETAKSRPLESDYLNQLFEKGLLRKKSDPDNTRRKIFVVKSQDDDKEEEENNNFLNHSLDSNNIEMIIQAKKLQKVQKMRKEV